MKRVLLIALMTAVIGCAGQTKKAATAEQKTAGAIKSGDVFVIDESTVPSNEPIGSREVGEIRQGEVVEVDLPVRNERNLPLIIFKASASCGCTNVSFPKEPIAKGETATIKATYNSKGKSGQQMVMVKLNTDAGDFPIRFTLFVNNN